MMKSCVRCRVMVLVCKAQAGDFRLNSTWCAYFTMYYLHYCNFMFVINFLAYGHVSTAHLPSELSLRTSTAGQHRQRHRLEWYRKARGGHDVSCEGAEDRAVWLSNSTLEGYEVGAFSVCGMGVYGYKLCIHYCGWYDCPTCCKLSMYCCVYMGVWSYYQNICVGRACGCDKKVILLIPMCIVYLSDNGWSERW